jgi:ribulose-phosphate 3-epimerase
MIKLAPSVLGADFSRLGEDIKSADSAGADWLHLDIMDGHFVPNISFGPSIVKTINNLSDTYLDVHLMLSEPEKYFEQFINAGADAITFHIEVHPDPTELLIQLKSMGVGAGLSLNPDASANNVLPYLKNCDLLLVMSVFPGFGGQSFIESALDTISTSRKFIDDNNLNTLISVDGGVGPDNAQRIVDAGADILVMGSAFFRSSERKEITEQVHNMKRNEINIKD